MKVKQSWVGQSLDHSDPRCEVIHTVTSGDQIPLELKLKFDSEPFVGGPDLIANGLVILPARKYQGTIVKKTTY